MKVLLISHGRFFASHLARRLLLDGHHVLEIDTEELGAHCSPTPNAPPRDMLDGLKVLAGQQPFDGVVLVHEPSRSGSVDTEEALVMQALEAGLSLAVAHQARCVFACVTPRRTAGQSGCMAGIQLCESYASRCGANIGVAKIEGVYGPQMPISSDYSLVGPLLDAAIKGGQLVTPVPRNGWHWPLHVRDAVRGVSSLLTSNEHRVVTLAGAAPVRTQDLIATVERILNVVLPITGDQMAERRADPAPRVGTARLSLRWRPDVALYNGLEELVHADSRFQPQLVSPAETVTSQGGAGSVR